MALADHPSLEMGSSDFTIEAWIRTSSTNVGIVSKDTNEMVNWGSLLLSVNHHGRVHFFINPHAGTSAGRAEMLSTSIVNTNTWVHVAVTRSGSTWRLLVNGALEATVASTAVMRDSSAVMYVGAFLVASSPSRLFAGEMDELRITRGVARYTANFAVPSLPFPGH